MSTLKVDSLLTTGGADQFTIKAWANWNNSTGITLRDNGNVSSITDISTGKTVLGLTNATPNVTYYLQYGGSEADTDGAQMFMCQILTTSTQEYQCDNGGGTPDNLDHNYVLVGY